MKLYDVAHLILFVSNVSELSKWICWKQVFIPMSDIFHQMFYLPMDLWNTQRYPPIDLWKANLPMDLLETSIISYV
jgi:hypothetical protein